MYIVHDNYILSLQCILPYGAGLRNVTCRSYDMGTPREQVSMSRGIRQQGAVDTARRSGVDAVLSHGLDRWVSFVFEDGPWGLTS